MKDHVNEPAAANTELQHSGSKWSCGTIVFVTSAVTVWGKSFTCFVRCFVKFMQQYLQVHTAAGSSKFNSVHSACQHGK